MILKTSFALAAMAMLAVPALAQTTPTDDHAMGDHAMAPADHMMASDHAMKPMTKHDTAMMAKCSALSAAAMKKNARCAKFMAMHPPGHM